MRAARRSPGPALSRRPCGVGQGSLALLADRSRMQSHEAKAGILGIAAGDVHRLDAVAGRALHEIVDRAERDDAFRARIEREADIGEVRSRDELRLGITPDAGALLHDPNEGFGAVGVSVDL